MKPDNLRKQGANSGGLESTDEEAKFPRALSNRGRFFSCLKQKGRIINAKKNFYLGVRHRRTS